MTREPGPAAGAAGDSGTDWRGDGLRPTWNLYRGMAQSTQNPARREAVLWALGQLENLMGPDWLERCFDHTGHVPAEVNLGCAHVAATGNLLDLALRYYVLAGAPGLDVVCGEMRGDVRDERRWHSALQLEVAALAARDGFTVALEAASPASRRPSDVTLARDGQELRVETFLLLPDEGTQEATEFWDKFSQDTLWIGGEFNVGNSGDLGRRVSGEDYQELLRQIRAAAEEAAATGQRQPVEYAGARLLILPPGEHDYQLNGAVEESRGWPRTESKLMKKARQAAEAGGGWLRADIRDGMWMFTPWARAGLGDKIEQIAQHVTSALRRVPGIDGAVLSNGAGFAQGEFHGESARTTQGCYGIRRVLPAARVRETMIIPVTPRGRSQATTWLRMYDAEEHWLDWALARAGIPTRHQIFGEQ